MAFRCGTGHRHGRSSGLGSSPELLSGDVTYYWSGTHRHGFRCRVHKFGGSLKISAGQGPHFSRDSARRGGAPDTDNCHPYEARVVEFAVPSCVVCWWRQSSVEVLSLSLSFSLLACSTNPVSDFCSLFVFGIGSCGSLEN
jgi:hypothetical protein